jgi:hypothetical protein
VLAWQGSHGLSPRAGSRTARNGGVSFMVLTLGFSVL